MSRHIKVWVSFELFGALYLWPVPWLLKTSFKIPVFFSSRNQWSSRGRSQNAWGDLRHCIPVCLCNIYVIFYVRTFPSLKLIYSEKATKFCDISTLLLTGTTWDKSKLEILPSQNIWTLLHKIIQFSNIMQFSDSFCGDQKCH